MQGLEHLQVSGRSTCCVFHIFSHLKHKLTEKYKCSDANKFYIIESAGAGVKAARPDAGAGAAAYAGAGGKAVKVGAGVKTGAAGVGGGATLTDSKLSSILPDFVGPFPLSIDAAVFPSLSRDGRRREKPRLCHFPNGSDKDVASK